MGWTLTLDEFVSGYRAPCTRLQILWLFEIIACPGPSYEMFCEKPDAVNSVSDCYLPGIADKLCTKYSLFLKQISASLHCRIPCSASISSSAPAITAAITTSFHR